MNCPYCNTEMASGEICTSGNRALYWMPKGTNHDFVIMSPQNIEKRGGFVIDMVFGGMITEVRPISYFCGKCNVIVTKPGEFSHE